MRATKKRWQILRDVSWSCFGFPPSPRTIAGGALGAGAGFFCASRKLALVEGRDWKRALLPLFAMRARNCSVTPTLSATLFSSTLSSRYRR